MFLRYCPDGSLMEEVLQLPALMDPFVTSVEGRFHAGEELQDPQPFAKQELCFPSGERLPRCWLDPDYASR
ncbi:MAG: acetyltransferase [Cyanobacteria bacterium K_DeepCast_35m_m2_023]|nr:acetyltransferase [Cyanobacteria bacterium K_DeepCast_35m_m2_023]